MDQVMHNTPDPKTLIVAEDDPTVLELMKLIVKKQAEQRGTPYNVIYCVDGAEALQAYEVVKGSVDLIVLNGNMPGKTGVEVIEELRAQGCETPIFLYTGWQLCEHGIGELVDSGYATYFHTPREMPDLVAAIDATLNGT